MHLLLCAPRVTAVLNDSEAIFNKCLRDVLVNIWSNFENMFQFHGLNNRSKYLIRPRIINSNVPENPRLKGILFFPSRGLRDNYLQKSLGQMRSQILTPYRDTRAPIICLLGRGKHLFALYIIITTSSFKSFYK